MKRINETTITEDAAAMRLDQYLARRFTYFSRTQWQREIQSGKISINGIQVQNVKRRLLTGDTVGYDGRGIAEPPVDPDYRVLYEDDWFLGVSKSGDLPTHPSGRYFANTLLMLLQEERREKLFPLHRLDRETSGVILFARDRETAAGFQKKFSGARKTYIAVVRGDFPGGTMTIDVPIGSDGSSVITKKRKAFHGADEPAVTHLRRMFRLGGCTVIKAMPETGRMHQIRVHCDFAGFPILGDKLYGADDSVFLDFIKNGLTDELRARLGFHRTALHSRAYSFHHPVLNRTITIKAPLPADMAGLITAARE